MECYGTSTGQCSSCYNLQMSTTNFKNSLWYIRWRYSAEHAFISNNIIKCPWKFSFLPAQWIFFIVLSLIKILSCFFWGFFSLSCISRAQGMELQPNVHVLVPISIISSINSKGTLKQHQTFFHIPSLLPLIRSSNVPWTSCSAFTSTHACSTTIYVFTAGFLPTWAQPSRL